MLLHRSRANELMRLCGLDALVEASPVNITYFPVYFCWLDPWEVHALFPLEAEPALVVNPIFAANAADLWVDDLFSFGDSGLDFSVSPAPTNPTDSLSAPRGCFRKAVWNHRRRFLAVCGSLCDFVLLGVEIPS